jgi:hypothetical protein
METIKERLTETGKGGRITQEDIEFFEKVFLGLDNKNQGENNESDN